MKQQRCKTDQQQKELVGNRQAAYGWILQTKDDQQSQEAMKHFRRKPYDCYGRTKTKA